ncbi:diapolycopene oxygenase [Bhargavaea cecembensis]|uniref:4,4'-diaponeurosporene oxygenase n=1 Tax=Bhargavaea cecembensis TaxID=394098 RepID=A0A161SQ09_9BACL|nr:phytoene desaturase family protein [Bhargavaea cecembensis]KZE37290.1 diapolycopene oxygenase [Bhargavaea cecembensis]
MDAQQQKTAMVIGGGLGGLSAAISLAQAGYRVSLYEQNQHLGGKLNRLEQDGFGFDLGPSILTMPHIFERLFHGAGKQMADYIPTVRLDREWRSFFPDGTVIDLYGDLEKMLHENDALDEKDIQDYRNLLHYSKGLYDITEAGYLGEEGLDTAKEVFSHHGPVTALRQFDLFSSMYGAIEKRISQPHFRTMLSYFIKYVGSSPYDAPAVLNMMIYMQHAQGVWYVPGGMDRIAQGLTRLAEECGVELHTGKKIIRLTDDGSGTITGAELEDGTKLQADHYISNMEVIPLYEKLLNVGPEKIRKLEKKFEPASSGLVLHLGLNRTYPQLSHHNFFFSDNLKEQMDLVFREHRLPDDPTIYLVNANKTDPAQAPEGHENLKVLPHIPYIQDKPFTTQDYLDFRERVLDKLERMGLEGLRSHIVTEDMWTPEDIRRVYGSHRGAIYGTVSDRKKNLGFKHPKESGLFDNLYFVGGTANPGGGMPMVTLSGQQAATKIIRKDRES